MTTTSTVQRIDPARLAKIPTLFKGAHEKNGNGHVEAERMSRNDRRARQWADVAGPLLAMARENLVTAMTLAARSPATTDHDYGRRA